MRIGGFELHDPLPELNEPYVFATLRPWIDVNGVGSLVLNQLEALYSATELGRLSRPGAFYDFTRYRPTIHLDEGIRDIVIPNTTIQHARREGQSDLLLLRLLEPHANAEAYIRSVVTLLTKLRAKKYVLLGSMYDAVPHTRPLLVSGYGSGQEAAMDLKRAGTLPIVYHGPSTIVNQITRDAGEAGIDTTVFIVSLPQYVVLGEDYLGAARLIEILNMLYGVPIDSEGFDKALEQRNFIAERLEDSPEVKALLPQLESAYDMRLRTREAQGMSRLTPEMEERFWKMIGKDLGKA